ncbi:MAG: AraC family transcriptional regulator [Bacteroidota bacterium]
MKYRKYKFERKKYGREFLLDCVFFSEADRKVVTGLPFCYDFHGIFIQSSGRAKIAIDAEIYSLKVGSHIFLRAHQVREWLSLTSNFSGYLLIFENEFIETFFNDDLFIHRFQFFQTNLPVVLECNKSFLIENVLNCNKIRTELSVLRDDSHHYIRSLIYNMLIQINRCYIKEFDLSEHLYQNDIALRFRKLLEKNIRNIQEVKEYAEFLKVSRSQLNMALRKSSGESASQMIRKRLVTEIKRDLLYSEKNISEIVYGLGFSDNSNFVRFFKTNTGKTPSEFRSEYQK